MRKCEECNADVADDKALHCGACGHKLGTGKKGARLTLEDMRRVVREELADAARKAAKDKEEKGDDDGGLFD